MMDNIKLMKYNPAFLTDEELIAGFVVRTQELESILTVVRNNTTGTNQHLLVEGPRGSGKTTLVRRAAAQIRKDETLCRQWFPLVFAEESYMVQTPGEFWLEAIFHLEHQTGNAKWGQIYNDLKKERDEVRLRETCLAKLIDFAREQNKKLILIVENMQMILGDQLSKDDAWVLRKTLQHESQIMLLCSGLAGRTADFDKESRAMYELFKRIELKPLTDTESRILWESVAGKPVTDNRIRPINILTGGNPRLVSIISKFGKDMSFRELMDNVIQLVDDNTEYFKSHLDNIAPVERKIYLALAEIWDPATSKQVADVARLDVNKTSAVLTKLQKEGRVAVETQKGRKKFYKIAERMYNIYYLMRRQGEASIRVKALVHFIVHFFESDELLKILKSIANEACGCDTQSRNDLCFAFMEILRQVQDETFLHQILSSVPDPFFCLPETIQAIQEMLSPDRLPKIFSQKKLVLAEVIKMVIEAVTHRDIALIREAKKKYVDLFNKLKDFPTKWSILGWLHFLTGENEEAINCLEKGVEVEPENIFSLKLLGNLYHETGEYLKAKTAYQKILELNENDLDTWLSCGRLLQEQFDEYNAAEEAYLRVLKEKPDDKFANSLLIRLYFKQKEWQKAIKVASEIIEKFPDEEDFYRLRGTALLNLGRFGEAQIDIDPALRNHPVDGFSCALIALLKLLMGLDDKAMADIKKMLQDLNFVKKECKDSSKLIISLFVGFAARGYAKELSEMLENSEAKDYLQPLAVALKLYQGQDVVVADEILEVAKDVVKRIEDQAKQYNEKSIDKRKQT